MTIEIPDTTIVRIHENERGKFVAHALEFDVVGVDTTREKALEKLRWAVRSHILHGFLMGRSFREIYFQARKEYWQPIEGSSFLRLLLSLRSKADETGS